jgi:hypothetical protein
LTIDIENSYRMPDSFCVLSGGMNPSRHCNVLCGRKKLPFAGYSIVKERKNGEYRARTGDLLVANQALSQLS